MSLLYEPFSISNTLAILYMYLIGLTIFIMNTMIIQYSRRIELLQPEYGKSIMMGIWLILKHHSTNARSLIEICL